MHTKPHAVRDDFDVEAVFPTSRCCSLLNYTSGRERAPDIRGRSKEDAPLAKIYFSLNKIDHVAKRNYAKCKIKQEPYGCAYSWLQLDCSLIRWRTRKTFREGDKLGILLSRIKFEFTGPAPVRDLQTKIALLRIIRKQDATPFARFQISDAWVMSYELQAR